MNIIREIMSLVKVLLLLILFIAILLATFLFWVLYVNNIIHFS